ncbi:MAG TPA: RNA-binding cell elongation regulator Jag/EloR [Candidatus Dormibacteraeota bacterium]|nr:RNA-binding cell elongation regulator Jag/EloR [Candidatus Dormibacteraeota bacterium]
MSNTSAYKEFTGKSVEEALRLAREEFGVGLDGLDFEILTPGSRGVLGMGAEPARILAAPRSELGGAAPKLEAAASRPLPPPPPRDRDDDRGGGRGFDRDRGRGGFDRDRGPRRDDRGGGFRDDRGPRRDDRGGPFDRDRGPRRDDRAGAPRSDAPRPFEGAPREPREARPPRDEREPMGDTPVPTMDRPEREFRPREDRGPRRDDRGPRRYDNDRPPRRVSADLTEGEAAEVAAARGSVASERAELEAAEASPEALAAGKVILEQLLAHIGFAARVDVETGETSRLNVIGEASEREELGALIGRKGERLSALQHLVNLMLSRQMGTWTRVLVDVEDYRGRRERQLREIAERAARRVLETGKMLQLEPMPALERRWIHLALKSNPDVATQSIGEEPNRRIVVLPRA